MYMWVTIATYSLCFTPYNFIVHVLHYPLLHRCSFKLSHTKQNKVSYFLAKLQRNRLNLQFTLATGQGHQEASKICSLE